MYKSSKRLSQEHNDEKNQKTTTTTKATTTSKPTRMLRTRERKNRNITTTTTNNNNLGDNNNNNDNYDDDDSYKAVTPKSIKQTFIVGFKKYITTIICFTCTLILGMFVQKENHTIDDLEPMLRKEFHLPLQQEQEQEQENNHQQQQRLIHNNESPRYLTMDHSNLPNTVPSEFVGLVNRAILHQQHCSALGLIDQEDHSGINNHTAHLPQFGILNAIHQYNNNNNNNNNNNIDESYPYQCTVPPEMECNETQFTVIFMAYNPDRLQKMYNQIRKMVTDIEFAPLVAEVIVVWNGERHVDETNLGQALVELKTKQNLPVRISYPLKANFPNDLMNRYHPRLNVQTKAVMYYDDDGPFYSFKATLGGFELWKRNANAQIGAMARKLDYSKRQQQERSAILNGPGDRFFVSHCPTDAVRYNFNEFANFGANMVLPSGSFLHSNYLCFLWHPIFAEIRRYVQQHPVNPDDGTVSAIVSQLSGRAPKVYSRRINESKQEQENNNNNNNNNDNANDNDNNAAASKRRRLQQSEAGEQKIDGQQQQHEKIKLLPLLEGTENEKEYDGTMPWQEHYSPLDDHDDDNDDIDDTTTNNNHNHEESLPLLSLEHEEDEYERYQLQQYDNRQQQQQRQRQRRRLMDGIDWDRGGGHDKKHVWGQLRSDAANSLVRYFGSMNSGSIGWCYGTKYQVGEYCKPEMARVGQLPWLKSDHTPREQCP